jgi:Mg-chelatase subunit ChlD
MSKKTADLILIVDRSGSMLGYIEDQTQALHTMLTEQRQAPVSTRVTLVQFDTEIETVFQRKHLNQVGKLSFQPRGGTALYDAIGQTVDRMGEVYAQLPEDKRPGTVTVVIVTDGLENSSIKYGAHRLKEMVQHQKDKYGWTFLYFGANQDAVLEGSRFGLDRDHTISFNMNAASYAGMGQTMSRAVTASSTAGSYAVTEADRQEVAQ